MQYCKVSPVSHLSIPAGGVGAFFGCQLLVQVNLSVIPCFPTCKETKSNAQEPANKAIARCVLDSCWCISWFSAGWLLHCHKINPAFHRIIQVGKESKIIESNLRPNTTVGTKPQDQVSCPVISWIALGGGGDSTTSTTCLGSPFQSLTTIQWRISSGCVAWTSPGTAWGCFH